MQSSAPGDATHVSAPLIITTTHHTARDINIQPAPLVTPEHHNSLTDIRNDQEIHV